MRLHGVTEHPRAVVHHAQVHVDNLGSIDTVVNIADDVEEDRARGTHWKKSEFYEAYEEVTGLLLYAVLTNIWFSSHSCFSFREVAFFLFKVTRKMHSLALWLSYCTLSYLFVDVFTCCTDNV